MRSQSLEKLEFPRVKEYLLREARTEPGREKLKKLEPFRELTELLEEQKRVQEIGRLLAEAGRLPIPELEALSPLVKGAVKGKVLSVSEAYLLRRYLETAEKVASFFRGRDLPGLRALVGQLPRLGRLRTEIFHLLAEDGSGVRTEASSRLVEIRRDIKTQEDRLRRRLEALLRKYAQAGWLQEELITKRRGRYVFPFKAEAKSRVPGLWHDTSASGATIYLEPLEIVHLTNELEDLHLAEEREVYRLLQELSQEVAQEAEALLQLEEILVDLDVLQAKAAFGERIRGILPKIRPEGEVRLLEAVHPLLLLAGRRVVANDFVFPSEKPVVVISGPNLGGKTVALKTFGLLVLMAQAAIPIPAASDSVIPFFEEILVDIGDEQDLEGESTFSAHVKNLKNALQEAGPGKLFLLDEIGRGTDPAEGAALAMAVLEALASSGARVLATTHYEALKAFSFAREDILSLSVSFDEQTGEPTYKLTYGVAGLSRGLLLAERLGLPGEILDRARTHLGRDRERFQELMLALQRALEEMEEEKEALQRERESLIRERFLLEQEAKKLREEWARKEAAREEILARHLRRLEQEFQAFLREIKEKRLSEKKASLRFGHFLKERIPPLSEEPRSQELCPGARVRLRGMGQEGRVLRLKGGLAEVQLGPFRVEVSIKDLEVLPEEGRPQKAIRFRVEAEKDVPSSVNLIGLTVEEALSQLEKVLDRAFLSGQSRLTVIHGLGTGRLMRAIRQYLSGHRQVARVRPGKAFEGGEAVTVVELAVGEGQGEP